MKNRALLLCLKYKIEYVEEYAQKIGISIDDARAIFEERLVMDEEVIQKNCDLFNVSRAYFLCLI